MGCCVCSVRVAYKLIAGIRSELLKIFKMLELTLCVSVIICVLQPYKTINCV